MKGVLGLPTDLLSSRVGLALLSFRAPLECDCIRGPSLHPAPPCSRKILGPRNSAPPNGACDRISGESIPAHGRAFVFLTAIGGGLAVGVTSALSPRLSWRSRAKAAFIPPKPPPTMTMSVRSQESMPSPMISIRFEMRESGSPFFGELNVFGVARGQATLLDLNCKRGATSTCPLHIGILKDET